jgi:hypothetical protein
MASHLLRCTSGGTQSGTSSSTAEASLLSPPRRGLPRLACQHLPLGRPSVLGGGSRTADVRYRLLLTGITPLPSGDRTVPLLLVLQRFQRPLT